MSDNIITSFASPNFSGVLFNKGNTRTPLSSALAGKIKYTNSVEFVTGQEYTTGGGSQPAISESDSLTAPDATFLTRSQKSNVTQIFMESVYISYAKQSNMGTLSGVNLEGQSANPQDELAFQVSARMTKIANDIEYTLLNGAYNKATADNEVNKTRGLVPAITTNVKAMANKPLDYWSIVDMMKTIYDGNAPVDGLTLLVDGTTLLQVNASCKELGIMTLPNQMTTAGLAVTTIVTPYGNLNMRLQPYMPSGTAVIANESALSVVYQPVPGKGNFFLEELAKTGAGTKYEIFGQLGLDHGPEWYHGKFTGIKTTFTAPDYAQKVNVSNTVTTKAAA